MLITTIYTHTLAKSSYIQATFYQVSNLHSTDLHDRLATSDTFRTSAVENLLDLGVCSVLSLACTAAMEA